MVPGGTVLVQILYWYIDKITTCDHNGLGVFVRVE